MASELSDRATDEELGRLREAIQDQRPEVRAHLARELGGEPDDYLAETYLADRTN